MRNLWQISLRQIAGGHSPAIGFCGKRDRLKMRRPEALRQILSGNHPVGVVESRLGCIAGGSDRYQIASQFPGEIDLNGTQSPVRAGNIIRPCLIIPEDGNCGSDRYQNERSELQDLLFGVNIGLEISADRAYSNIPAEYRHISRLCYRFLNEYMATSIR